VGDLTANHQDDLETAIKVGDQATLIGGFINQSEKQP
jgi:hypothetical protein